MKNSLKLVRLATVAGALALAAVSTTQATPVITISDGTSTYIIVDNGAATPAGAPAFGPNGSVLPDQDGAPGVVTALGMNLFNNAITLTLDTGNTKPNLGSPSSPNMRLNAQLTGSAAAVGQTYTVSFFETGFNAASGLALATLGGGLLNGTITYKTYFNPTNSNFTLGSLISTQTYSNNGVLGNNNVVVADTTGNLSSATTYSLAQQLIFNFTQPGSIQATGTLSVPDNGLTVALLGLALLSVEAMRRMFNGKPALKA